MRNFASVFSGVMVVVLLALSPHAAAAENVANGIFLVATKALRDPNFRETVVLVTQPRDSGPFGVIINRPLARRLADVLPGDEALKGRRDVIYYGGPVARDGLVFLVRSQEPPVRALRILKDVYVTAQRSEIEGALNKLDSTTALRVYAGHSGWAPGQLQNEIARGSWHVLPADAQTVFEKDPATLWPELSKRAALRRTAVPVRPQPERTDCRSQAMRSLSCG